MHDHRTSTRKKLSITRDQLILHIAQQHYRTRALAILHIRPPHVFYAVHLDATTTGSRTLPELAGEDACATARKIRFDRSPAGK